MAGNIGGNHSELPWLVVGAAAWTDEDEQLWMLWKLELELRAAETSARPDLQTTHRKPLSKKPVLGHKLQPLHGLFSAGLRNLIKHSSAKAPLLVLTVNSEHSADSPKRFIDL